MYNVDFDIKILTPLYMFGANQNWLEIRSASFKGILRFWWRALKCCDDYAKLKAIEEGIFGGVSEEAGKSKVNISIKHNDPAVSGNLKMDYNLKWYFNGNRNCLDGDNKGVGYLFYSVLRRNKKRGIYPKKYFKPGEVFRVSLYSRDELTLQNAVAAFWCAINLGGFGARSRRGAGSLTIQKVIGDTYDLNFEAKNCKNKTELVRWIVENTNKAAQTIKLVDSECSSYSNLSSASFIISDKDYETWYEALSDIGGIYADFRHNYKNDIQSGIFGFPVWHMGGGTIKAVLNGEEIKRRSSPLLFKVIKCGKRYHWMALRFAGNFLPSGAKLVWEGSNNGSFPTFRLLDRFWDSLRDNNGGDHRFFNLRGETI